MTSQKALILPAALGDFIIASRPIPVPGPGDVLVRNEAVALNPVDRHLQKTPMGVQYLKFPAIIGIDFAGVVVKVGAGVTSLQEGDRVVASGHLDSTERCAFQEYTVASAKYASKLPTDVSFDEASSIPLTMMTAAVGFYQKGAMGAGLRAPWEDNGRRHYKGTPILITGGASSVGCFGSCIKLHLRTHTDRKNPQPYNSRRSPASPPSTPLPPPNTLRTFNRSVPHTSSTATSRLTVLFLRFPARNLP